MNYYQQRLFKHCTTPTTATTINIIIFLSHFVISYQNYYILSLPDASVCVFILFYISFFVTTNNNNNNFCFSAFFANFQALCARLCLFYDSNKVASEKKKLMSKKMNVFDLGCVYKLEYNNLFVVFVIIMYRVRAVSASCVCTCFMVAEQMYIVIVIYSLAQQPNTYQPNCPTSTSILFCFISFLFIWLFYTIGSVTFSGTDDDDTRKCVSSIFM